MRTIFLLLFFYFFQGCLSGDGIQKEDCEQFHLGDFIQYDHEENLTIKYNRTDTLQTETNLKENNVYLSRVVWLNSCEYDLYKISSDKRYPSVDSIRGNRPLHVSIIKTTNNYYVF